MKRLLILFTFIATLAQAQGPWLNQNTYTAAGTNTYTVTIPMYLGYTAGNEVKIRFTNPNSGAATLNISNGTTSYGARTLQKNGGALSSGDLVAGGTYRITYDGTNFQVLGIGGSGGGGGGSPASLAEAQAGTDNTKVMTPLRVSEITKDKSTGNIYSKSSWANLNDFDITGTSPTIVSNEISFSNSFTLNHYATLKTSVANITSRQNWYFSTIVQVGSGLNGAWIGLRSSAINKMSLIAYWSAGTLAMQGGEPVWSAVGSSASLSASVNDLLFIDMRRIGNRIIVTGRNITTGGSQVVIDYIFPSSTVPPVTTPNTGRFSFGSFGNVVYKNVSISSTDQQGADLAIIGDSITDLYSVSTFSKHFTNLLRRVYDVLTFAGPNDTSTDALTRVQEVIDAKPKNVILYCWINDTASGLSTATSIANVNALYTALNAAGINVLFMNYYNTVANLSYMETHLSSTYPTRLINPMPLMNPNALSADGVHMNDLGNEIYAQAIKGSNLIVTGKNYGGLKSLLAPISTEIGDNVLNANDKSIPYFNSSNIAQSNNFVFDYTNTRLGIGTTTPTFNQDIRSGDYYQQLIKTTNSSTVAGTIYENNRGTNLSNGLIAQRGSATTPDYFGGSISDVFTIASYGANSQGLSIGSITNRPVRIYSNDVERLNVTSTGVNLLTPIILGLYSNDAAADAAAGGSAVNGTIYANSTTGQDRIKVSGAWRDGSGGSVTPTANSLVLRDANANHFANNEILGFQSIATAGGTTTLTVASPYETQFTGTSAQTLVLPNATTLTVGQSFHINNSSTLAITINTNGGAGLFTMATGTDITLVCTSIGTAAGTWDIDYLGLSVATTKRLTVNNSLTLAGTDATTMTFPTTSATIARTDAANTFTGVQTMTSPSITTSTTTSSTTFSNFNTTATTVNNFGAATTYTLGGTPTTALTATLFGNATATATTKTLNIATAGAAGSTTNVNIGSSVASAILGTISLNAPTILTANNNTTVSLWNTNSTNINFGGAVTGTLNIGNSAGLVASAARVTAPNHINGFTTTATAAATTTLTVTSNFIQTFTGTTTQTLTLPVVTTMVNGQMFRIVNLSTGVVTVNTSGANTIKAMAANSTIDVWVINTAGGTGTASWNWLYTAAINN